MATLKFGSFPRSGSHFFTHLTRCEWLSHRIESLSAEQCVVVSIRHPVECVPSWIVLTNDHRIDRAERVLEWYCAYYEHCAGLDIVIIPFHQLISDPLTCINYSHSRYGLPTVDALEYDLSTKFHYPTCDKGQYDMIISEMRDTPYLARALTLFETLCVPVG